MLAGWQAVSFFPMSAVEVIAEIESLPQEDQKRVFSFLAGKMASAQPTAAKPWLGKHLSFEEACDVVFRENRDLLNLLAK